MSDAAINRKSAVQVIKDKKVCELVLMWANLINLYNIVFIYETCFSVLSFEVLCGGLPLHPERIRLKKFLVFFQRRLPKPSPGSAIRMTRDSTRKTITSFILYNKTRWELILQQFQDKICEVSHLSNMK